MESFVNKRVTHAKPEYTFYIERLNTYSCWPIQIAQTKESLARAGFERLDLFNQNTLRSQYFETLLFLKPLQQG